MAWMVGALIAHGEVLQRQSLCLGPNYRSIAFFFFFVFLGLHLWHMEVSRLGVGSDL